MMEPELRDTIERKIAALKEQIAMCDQRIAVHPKDLDDPKKGRWCLNRKARLHHQRQRIDLSEEWNSLEALLHPLQEHGTDSEHGVVDGAGDAEGAAP
jgi:hypothetical protein